MKMKRVLRNKSLSSLSSEACITNTLIYFHLRPSQEGEAAFEELERTFATLDFEEIFQNMEITNAGLELPRMKLDFSANLKRPLQDIGVSYHQFIIFTIKTVKA